MLGARRPRRTLHPGDHVPAVPGTGLRPHVSAETGRVLVTVAPPGAAATPAPGLRQFLVADRAGEVPGYAAVIADPERRAAARSGLPAGGRVMVRPDGYAGSVGDLEDHETIAAYARLLGQDGSWPAGR